jgi:uncharacterized lipoprotein YajG
MLSLFRAGTAPLLARWSVLTIALLALCVGPGCIPPPPKTTIDTVTLTPVANPIGRPRVYISNVNDLREFTADLNDPSIPCMVTSTDVADPAIQSQTIGIYHKTNVLLHPGQTVQSLITEAITNALRARGYTVVAPGEGNLPVEADIMKCWMWAGTGDAGLKMKTVIEIKLRSPIALGGTSQIVNAEYEINSPFTTVSVGLATVADAMDALSKNIQPAVKTP